MATLIDGIVHTGPTDRPWTDWKRCFMVGRRASITGNLIWGWGWFRECDGIFEDPNSPGFFFVPGEEFAKTKKEIFIRKLKEEDDIRN